MDEIRALATGEFWSGKRALQLGLVDALGDREEALEELARLSGVSSRRTALVTPPVPFMARFLSRGMMSITSSLTESIRAEVEDALYSGLLGPRR